MDHTFWYLSKKSLPNLWSQRCSCVFFLKFYSLRFIFKFCMRCELRVRRVYFFCAYGNPIGFFWLFFFFIM